MKKLIALLIGAAFSLVILYIGVQSLIAAFTAEPKEPRLAFLAFGLANTIFAISNAVVLFLAWRSPTSRLPLAAAWLGAAVVVTGVVGSLDSGGVDGLEVAGILGIMVFPAALNWAAVRALTRE